jgi:hypothetical protein
MEALLGANVTAQQDYEITVPILVAEGLADIREPLVYFLTVALIHPNATQSTPYTVQPQARVRGYAPSLAAISHHRECIVHRDLPSLHPILVTGPSDPVPLAVARGVSDMVAEARADRTDREASRELSRHP